MSSQYPSEIGGGVRQWMAFGPRKEALRYIPKYEEGAWAWKDLGRLSDATFDHDKVSRRSVLQYLCRDNGLVVQQGTIGNTRVKVWRTAPCMWDKLEEWGVERDPKSVEAFEPRSLDDIAATA